MTESWDLDSFVVLDPSRDEAAPLPANDRYQLLELLGKGGMGAVYRARDTELGRDVAIKVITKEDYDGQRRERFERECQLAASLRHPHIVTIHGVGEANGAPFMVSELIVGARTLTEALPLLERRERLEVIRDVASALGFAHERGVIHRDVKPQNVLFDPEGRALLADFGLATAVDLNRLTQTGALIGTPAYMSPEQLHGSSEDHVPATDVWALGVLLYQALTDQPPFPCETLIQLSTAIRSGPPVSPRLHDPSIPAALEAISLKALRFRPEDRYPNGRALASDLQAYLDGTLSDRGLDPLVVLLGVMTLVATTILLLLLSARVPQGSERAAVPSPSTPAPTRAPSDQAPSDQAPPPLSSTPTPTPTALPLPWPPPGAAGQWRKRVAAAPGDLVARATLALKLIPLRIEGVRSRRLDQAESEAARHLKIVFDHQPPDPDALPIAHFARSTLRGRLGDHKGALEDCWAVVRYLPRHVQAWFQVAALEAVYKNWSAVEKAATNAIALGGGSRTQLGVAHYLRAIAREQAQERSGAARDYRAAATLLPVDHASHASAAERASALEAKAD